MWQGVTEGHHVPCLQEAPFHGLYRRPVKTDLQLWKNSRGCVFTCFTWLVGLVMFNSWANWESRTWVISPKPQLNKGRAIMGTRASRKSYGIVEGTGPESGNLSVSVYAKFWLLKPYLTSKSQFPHFTKQNQKSNNIQELYCDRLRPV